MTRIVASIEARMNSSRLPGKVLMDVCSQSALSHLYGRLKQSRLLSDIILATTTNPEDDALASWAKSNDVLCFRGSENDVLDRVVSAHTFTQSDIIVEVTGDCPLLDPEIIDLGIETFLANDCDVVTNCRVPSFPQGVDVQVFSFQNLEWVSKHVDDLAVRVHVSLYFYENPQIYNVFNLIAPVSIQSSNTRLQLDYLEDLKVIRSIYSHFKSKGDFLFSTYDVLNFLRSHPRIASINANCIEKPTR